MQFQSNWKEIPRCEGCQTQTDSRLPPKLTCFGATIYILYFIWNSAHSLQKKPNLIPYTIKNVKENSQTRSVKKQENLLLELCWSVALLVMLLLVACNKLFQLTKLNLHSCSFHVATDDTTTMGPRTHSNWMHFPRTWHATDRCKTKRKNLTRLDSTAPQKLSPSYRMRIYTYSIWDMGYGIGTTGCCRSGGSKMVMANMLHTTLRTASRQGNL